MVRCSKGLEEAQPGGHSPINRRQDLRIATFQLKGRRLVGLVSADGQSITPFDLPPEQMQRGAQALIEAGDPKMTPLQGASVAISSVKLEAPLPVPRRNVFCVGRNYHAHAKELQA